MIGQISLTVRRTDSGGQIQVRARAVHVAASAPRKVCQYREGAREGEYLVRPRRRALVLQEGPPPDSGMAYRLRKQAILKGYSNMIERKALISSSVTPQSSR